MYRADVSIEIQASREKVFALLANLPLLGEVHPNVISISYKTSQTIGPGTISTWVVKKPNQPQIEFDERITEWIENTKIGFETITGRKMSGELVLEDSEQGTKLLFWEAIHESPPPDLKAKKTSMMAQLDAMKKFLEREGRE